MSLNTSLVMLEGDHLGRAQEVFSTFGYEITGEAEEFHNWDAALDAQQDPRPDKPRGLVHKAVFVHNGWTVLLDLEGVMWTNTAACTQSSERLGCRLFAMCCAGVTSSYSYGLYEGQFVRAFWWDATAGVVEDKGDRLLEEEGINFEEFGEEDVLKVMERFGVNYSDLQGVAAFRVFELSLSVTSDDTTLPAVTQPPTSRDEQKKPWWKFW